MRVATASGREQGEGCRDEPRMSPARADVVERLRRRVAASLRLGALRPEDRLPGLRELAREFGVTQRTTAGAFRELEREGLVEVRARSGAYVARDAISPGWLLPRFREWLAGVLVEGIDRGVPAPDLPERVRRCLETLRLRAACVECNAGQLEWMCAELQRDYGFETASVDLAHIADGPLPPELRRADLLVTTAFHAAEIQRLAERLRKPRVTVVLRVDSVAEVTQSLARARVLRGRGPPLRGQAPGHLRRGRGRRQSPPARRRAWSPASPRRG